MSQCNYNIEHLRLRYWKWINRGILVIISSTSMRKLSDSQRFEVNKKKIKSDDHPEMTRTSWTTSELRHGTNQCLLGATCRSSKNIFSDVSNFWIFYRTNSGLEPRTIWREPNLCKNNPISGHIAGTSIATFQWMAEKQAVESLSWPGKFWKKSFWIIFYQNILQKIFRQTPKFNLEMLNDWLPK